jgi:hypothetical protein
MDAKSTIQRAANGAPDRAALWGRVVGELRPQVVAEVGVWLGEFAEHLLRTCPDIRTYYLLDPWRQLADWNKPFNVSDDEFRAVMDEALARTAFAADRRQVLRGTTVEMAGQVPDQSLDFCYVDGDHTLRGVIVDLVRLYPKVRDGGILAGDDFVPSGWQHGPRFEPTLVFPTAVYFAEATGSVIYSLPHAQFAIIIDRTRDAFAVRDLAGGYGDLTVRGTLEVRRDGWLRKIVRRLHSISTK